MMLYHLDRVGSGIKSKYHERNGLTSGMQQDEGMGDMRRGTRHRLYKIVQSRNTTHEYQEGEQYKRGQVQ